MQDTDTGLKILNYLVSAITRMKVYINIINKYYEGSLKECTEYLIMNLIKL